MAASKTYRIHTGLHYKVRSGEKRAEPGDVVADLPANAVRWLTERGHIEPVADEADTTDNEGID